MFPEDRASGTRGFRAKGEDDALSRSDVGGRALPWYGGPRSVQPWWWRRRHDRWWRRLWSECGCVQSGRIWVRWASAGRAGGWLRRQCRDGERFRRQRRDGERLRRRERRDDGHGIRQQRVRRGLPGVQRSEWPGPDVVWSERWI